MNLHQCPVLTMVVVKQRHQDDRNEVQREHAARIAAPANMASKDWPWIQLKALAASIHAVSVHQLAGAARRMEIRLSAR
jgi:HD-like signal output (HDOD) protein